MSFFTQNPGGFNAPHSVLVQRVNRPAANISSKKSILPIQIGGESEFGPSMPGFSGEKHVYMKAPDGGILPIRANFAGPGTALKARLARGDKPINEVDKISMAHDLRYGLATNYDDVRKADKIMIRALQESKDKSIANKSAKAVMQGKLLLERSGMTKPGFFAQHAKNQTPQELAMYQSKLDPLAQEGYGPAFTGTPGTDQYHQRPLGSTKKGSQAAKDKMARLRAMRKIKGGMKGGALRLAGNGLTLAGSGKLAKKMMIRNKQKQSGGFVGLLSIALPTLIGLALKGGVSYGVSKASEAAIKKISGKGQRGGSMTMIKNLQELLRTEVSEPLKQQALKILESVRDKPELVESAFRKIMPILMKISNEVVASQVASQAGGAGGFKGWTKKGTPRTGSDTPRNERVPGGDYSEAARTIGPLEASGGIMGHVYKYVGNEILQILKDIASGATKAVFGGRMAGKGIFTQLEKGITKVSDTVSDVTNKIAAGLSGSELQTVKEIVSDVTKHPSVLENPQYLANKGRALSPLGQRLLNDLLRKQGIPVAISIRV